MEKHREIKRKSKGKQWEIKGKINGRPQEKAKEHHRKKAKENERETHGKPLETKGKSK